MIPIHIDPDWSTRFPGARMGLLLVQELVPQSSAPSLEAARRNLEDDLRQRYGAMDRKQLRELPVMQAFEAHYKRHGKTYHILQQLESVASKGRSIPSFNCAVTALFMSELKHGLVAAGHDLDRIIPPLKLSPSQAGESYTNLAGKTAVLPEGDMTLSHAHGLLSSVLHGPDRDTPIGPATQHVLFTIYAPGGIPAGVLEAQLSDLAAYLACFAPQAQMERAIIPA